MQKQTRRQPASLITIEKYCEKRITGYRNLLKATAFATDLRQPRIRPTYSGVTPLRAIKLIDFSVEGKQLDVHIDFQSGSKFPCAKALASRAGSYTYWFQMALSPSPGRGQGREMMTVLEIIDYETGSWSGLPSV